MVLFLYFPAGELEDCWQLMRKGRKQSGVYSIQPRYSPKPFFVYCDMETDGGGWTVSTHHHTTPPSYYNTYSLLHSGGDAPPTEVWLLDEYKMSLPWCHKATNDHNQLMTWFSGAEFQVDQSSNSFMTAKFPVYQSIRVWLDSTKHNTQLHPFCDTKLSILTSPIFS